LILKILNKKKLKYSKIFLINHIEQKNQMKTVNLTINSGKLAIERNGLLRVEAYLTSGVLSIYTDHQPLLGLVAYDQVKIYSEDGSFLSSFIIDRGILTVGQQGDITNVNIITSFYVELTQDFTPINVEKEKVLLETQEKALQKAYDAGTDQYALDIIELTLSIKQLQKDIKIATISLQLWNELKTKTKN